MVDEFFYSFLVVDSKKKPRPQSTVWLFIGFVVLIAFFSLL
jgi:hypothetical protein